MTFDLKPVLKALLFSTSSPLTVKSIQSVFTRFHQQNNGASAEEEAAEVPEGDESEGESDELRAEDVPSLVTSTQIREAVDEINRELDERDDVYRIVEGHDGYRFVTRPRYAIWIRLLREDPKKMRLSQAALETLAIVAYRQPVTRPEMESIRGVSVDGALNRLIERELVAVTGRADLPGRPIQYGTTEKFLEFVGLRSLEELPASDVLSQRQIDEWLRDAATPHHPGDSDVGLPEEPGQGGEPDAADSGTGEGEAAHAGETGGDDEGGRGDEAGGAEETDAAEASDDGDESDAVDDSDPAEETGETDAGRGGASSGNRNATS